MINRYERISALEQIRNHPDSPIEIVAGALLHDKVTNQKLAQFKFRLNGNDVAKKVVFKIVGYDANHNSVVENEYYFNQQCLPNNFYGADKPLYFSQAISNSIYYFDIELKYVLFDNYTWPPNVLENITYPVDIIYNKVTFKHASKIKFVFHDEKEPRNLYDGVPMRFNLKKGIYTLHFTVNLFMHQKLEIEVHDGPMQIYLGWNTVSGMYYIDKII